MTRYRGTEYGVDEISTLLRAVDRHLTVPARMVIVGGAAAAFHHADSATADIDTYEALESALEDAIQRAATETGAAIPISHSAIAQVPYHSEDRLQRKLVELQRLEVWVLERHDLALSKVIRYYQHDLRQLKEMHLAHPFDFSVLIERYERELVTVGDANMIRGNFLDLIQQLFGELKRLEAERLTSR